MSISVKDAAQSVSPPVVTEDRLTLRWLPVCLLASVLIVLNCGWIANSEMRTGVTEVTISTLFSGVTFALFVITVLNLLARRVFGPKGAFNPAELMALYTMLSMSSVVAGVGHFGFFLTFLANPFHYNTPSNDWESFWAMLPSYIGPRDKDILKGFYEGHSNAFRPEVLWAWAYPFAVWSVFFLLLIWTTLCVSVLLRRRWADEERLPFPVIALPLEMVKEGAPLYRSRLMWLGFLIPASLHSLNSLQFLYPSLPSFPINALHDLVWDAPLLYPYNGVGSLFYLLHGSGIGFGYLVNTDISFSLWFFYLLKKVILIASTATGWREAATGWGTESNDKFPYFGYQGWGAWLALGLAALWTSRKALAGYYARAIDGDAEGVDKDEAMSARVAVLGFFAGFLSLCAFAWSWGGSWWLPVVFLLLYLIFMLGITRMRAEMPVVCTELVWITPQAILPVVLGTTGLSQMDLTRTAILSWFNLDYRAVAMPHQLEGIVGMKSVRGRMRTLVYLIMFAAAVAIIASLLWDLQLYYSQGAATGNVNQWRIDKGSEPWRNLQGWLHNPKPPNQASLYSMAFGAGVTILLSVLRSRFMDFPFHPAAYAMNMSFAADFFWCDMFVAWGIKSLILRYGGIQFYRSALPFFLGLILGDFVTGAAWSLFGSLTGLEMFRTFAI